MNLSLLSMFGSFGIFNAYDSGLLKIKGFSFTKIGFLLPQFLALVVALISIVAFSGRKTILMSAFAAAFLCILIAQLSVLYVMFFGYPDDQYATFHILLGFGFVVPAILNIWAFKKVS